MCDCTYTIRMSTAIIMLAERAHLTCVGTVAHGSKRMCENAELANGATYLGSARNLDSGNKDEMKFCTCGLFYALQT